MKLCLDQIQEVGMKTMLSQRIRNNGIYTEGGGTKPGEQANHKSYY